MNMKKSNIKNVKSNNRALILNCIRSGAVSRAEIVKQTELSKASVTMIINEYIAEGSLVEQGIEVSGNVGRPPVKIDIAKNYRYAAGFALHREQLSVAIINLKSEIVDCVTIPTKSFKTPESAINHLYNSFTEMCKKHRIPASRIIGFGISSPGPLNFAEGVVLTPPGFELFHEFNIKKHMATLTDLPVFLDNNSVLLAICEDSKQNRDYKSYMFLVATNGIGSAIITEHNIYRGSVGYSGEIGHISVDFNGEPCTCGNRGCLEQYVTMKKLKEKFNFDSYTTLVDQCYENNANSKKVLAYIAEMLSTAIVNAVNLLDLEAVVMYGDFNYRSDMLFSLISDKVNSRSIIANAHKIEILPASIGENGNIICSAAAIIKAYFEQRL